MTPLLEAALWNAAAATLLAGIALLASHLVRRPALAHALWLLVLLKLVTPPIFAWPLLPAPEVEPAVVTETATVEPIPIPILAPVEREARSMPPPVELEALPIPPPVFTRPAPVAPPPSGELPWAVVLLSAWFAGAGLLVSLALFRAIRFGRLARKAEAAPRPLVEDCRRLAGRLKLRRRIELRLIRGRISPLTWVVPGRARILLPEALLSNLDRGQREAVLAHELAHLARRDHLVRWFELLVVSLWWWLPVAWWARRGLREAEERCCDAWVAWTIPGSAGSYAAALMKTLDFLAGARPLPLAVASGMGAAGRFERRFRMIIDGNKSSRRLSVPGRLTLLALALIVLPGTVGVATAEEPEPGVEAPPPKPAEDAFEKRLERLEKLTETLVDELKALRSAGEKPKPGAPDTRTTELERTEGYRDVTGKWAFGYRREGSPDLVFPVTIRGRDGREYTIVTQIGLVMCKDPSGQKLWVANLEEPIRGQVTFAQNGWIRVSTLKENGKVFNLDPATGKILAVSHWGHSHKPDLEQEPDQLRALLATMQARLDLMDARHQKRLADLENRIAEIEKEKTALVGAHRLESASLRKVMEAIRAKLESGK